jgi:hypothetical protein
MRHLVCVPYSVENLHEMARALGIGVHWFHRGASHAHYDVPKRMMASIGLRASLVDPREILAICKGERDADRQL